MLKLKIIVYITTFLFRDEHIWTIPKQIKLYFSVK